MPRVIWKGAITFGLVHIPVNLYPGATERALDLDLLDKRDFAPVGYRRVNKRTGEAVAPADIVKGYEYEKGEYVVVTDADIRAANVEATQTIEIQAFVEGARIEPYYFDAPYYLEPVKRGEKGYALLRETLRRTGRVGVATVVLRARQHLAAVMPVERLLVLNTLRFAGELRPVKGLALPAQNLKSLGVSGKALDMAERLVGDMSERWRPETFKDTYREALLARIERKAKSGKAREVSAADDAPPRRRGAEVIDLMALLKRSLDAKGGRSPKRARTHRRRAA